MQIDQIFPSFMEGVDVHQVYEIEKYQFVAEQERRLWLTLNMVSSLDGSATREGLSGQLGGEGDKLIFNALRSVADFILVGANTARQEKYRKPKVSEGVRERRIARGQSPVPRLVLITRSLNIDPSSDFLGEVGVEPEDNASQSPIIYTTKDASEEREKALEERAEIRKLGIDGVDLDELLDDLTSKDSGGRNILVLAEGGRTLNGQLATAGLIDELCMTLSPQIVGGNDPGIIQSPEEIDVELSLVGVLTDEDGMLYLRYQKNKEYLKSVK